MDHERKIAEADEVDLYMERDVYWRKNSGTVPYAIVKDDKVGRHMVAARDIAPGEVIFVEAPLTFGPNDDSRPVCLGCYRRVKALDYLCSGCGYPMCGKDCQEQKEHKNLECKNFQRVGYKADPSTFNFSEKRGNEDDIEPNYAIISLVRALAIKESDEATWNLIWNHMSHHSARKKSTLWAKTTRNVLEAYEKAMGAVDNGLRHTIEVLLGILLVNDFEIAQDVESDEASCSIRALYALASMPSHSCVANATHDFSSRETGYMMTMRSVTSIVKGEDITHSYAEPLDPILQRRSLLRVGKFFDCECPRCADATEMSTFSSAVWCQKCRKGPVVSSNVKDYGAKWECRLCHNRIPCKTVEATFRGAKSEADRLEADDSASITDYETFVRKYASRILHPNHVVLVGVKYNLAKMYGRMSGCEPDKMSPKEYERKKQLCEDVLSVLDKIIPGNTRMRGMMLYELHLPCVMLANRALQMGPHQQLMSRQEIKASLKRGLQCLKMGLDILALEPENSFERKIVDASHESVAQLDEWVRTVCSSI